MEPSSRLAGIARGLAVAGALLFVLGPLLIQLGAVTPFLGFRTFLLGTLLGLLAVPVGLLGLWSTRAAAGRAGRGKALLAVWLGAALVAVVLVLNSEALRLPPINDISTDLDDPPVFVAIAELDANRGRDMSHPGEAFARAQRGAYPELAPIELGRSPEQAFADARAAATELGWGIVAEDPQGGTLEATEVSGVFRFVDDVVVRVRPAPGGSVVDVRSKSRVGRGDLGANAARIRAFGEALGG